MLTRTTRAILLRRAEALHLCGWSIPEISNHLKVPQSTLARHFSSPETRERIVALAERPLQTLSKQGAAALAVARDHLSAALPLVADRLVNAALAPFFIERVEEDGTISRVPNPDFPPSFIETAIKLVLERGGITQRFADSLTNNAPIEPPPAPTPEHIDALTRLIQAAKAPPPPISPPSPQTHQAPTVPQVPGTIDV